MLKLVKTCLFCVVASVMALWLFGVYSFSDNVSSKAVFEDFYELPKNSLDAIWIGPSSVREYLVPSEAFAHSGVAIYGLATGNQPFFAASSLIEEAEKTQNPKMYLVDIRSLCVDLPVIQQHVMRYTSNMHISKTWLSAIEGAKNTIGQYYPEQITDTYDEASYYFGFPMFHSRRDINSTDFGYDPNAFLGFTVYNRVEKMNYDAVMKLRASAEIPLSPAAENQLKVMIDYCDRLDKRVVFTCTPNCLSQEEFGKANYVKRILAEHGYEVLDLNDSVDSIGLDYSHDFKNTSHVNVWGAVKVTDYVSQWLSTQEGVTDHRGDEQYSGFVKAQQLFLAKKAGVEKAAK